MIKFEADTVQIILLLTNLIIKRRNIQFHQKITGHDMISHGDIDMRNCLSSDRKTQSFFFRRNVGAPDIAAYFNVGPKYRCQHIFIHLPFCQDWRGRQFFLLRKNSAASQGK